MGGLKLRRFLLLCLVLVIKQTAAQDTSYSSEKLPKRQNVVTIDLTRCICSSVSDCELTIIKSSLMEVTCSEDENLCCPMTRLSESLAHEPSKNVTEDADEPQPQPPAAIPSPVTNVRVYSINALHSDKLGMNKTELAKSKAKKNCRCKSRGTCPGKYIDYGFGFHCTYNTVRCCMPEEDDTLLEIEQNATATLNETGVYTGPSLTANVTNVVPIQENTAPEMIPNADIPQENDDNVLNTTNEVEVAQIPSENTPAFEDLSSQLNLNPQNTEGELLITEVTNWKEPKCYCLPIQKCRIAGENSLNGNERRRDTLCPGELIQCCGFDVVEEITKKKDDSESDFDSSAQINHEFPSFVLAAQPPEATAGEVTQNHRDEALPSLPLQDYNYGPAIPNNGYTYPQPNAYPASLSGFQNHQDAREVPSPNTRHQLMPMQPWANSPSSYSNNNNKYAHAPMSRGPYPGYPGGGPYKDGSGGIKKPGGLLDTLTKLLG